MAARVLYAATLGTADDAAGYPYRASLLCRVYGATVFQTGARQLCYLYCYYFFCLNPGYGCDSDHEQR